MKKMLRWVPQTLYQFWRQKAEHAYWFQVRDQRPTPSFSATYQSGLYLADGTPKPIRDAFRFPFAAFDRGPKAEIWGRAPTAGRVTIERRSGNRWRQAASIATDDSGIFRTRIRAGSNVRLRARAGDETSDAVAPSERG
jgi:hypothetical protein